MEKSVLKNNFFVLTGAPGSGKSSIIDCLNNRNMITVAEPAREIIAEQRKIEGEGLYDKDKKLFVELMLLKSIFQYKNMMNLSSNIIFDRCILDNIGYAKLFELNIKPYMDAAETFKYNNKVFYTKPWEEIYTTDDERRMSFVDAAQFGEIIKNIYLDLGYNIIEVPLASINERADFILDSIA